MNELTGPRVTFYGAAQAVTGSMHLLEFRGQQVLLDCGLTLGRSSEVRERNRHFPFLPKSVHAVLLSHAHVDHCGRLPTLVRQGYRGPIYCTPATRDLIAIMLADSARIQEQDAWVEQVLGRLDEESTVLLDAARDVERVLEQCVPVPYGQAVEVGDGMTARFHDAGHLLGSAMIEVACTAGTETRTITYTGDLGRPALRFLREPAPLPPSDLIISESTYGGRMHQPLAELMRRLRETVVATIDRGGKVMIPAFNLGRAQLVVHYIRHWMGQGVLPVVPIYVDSGLAADIAEVYRHHPASLIPEARADFVGETPVPVQYVRDKAESRALSTRRGPCVLVASGGMCEAGRIVGHLEQNVDDPRNSVVLVSYQAPGSLGRKLLDRGPTVAFRGKVWNKWAAVVDLNGFSGHADQHDFLNAFRPLAAAPPRVRLVHGEYEQANALADVLRAEGYADVEIPRREDRVLVA